MVDEQRAKKRCDNERASCVPGTRSGDAHPVPSSITTPIRYPSSESLSSVDECRIKGHCPNIRGRQVFFHSRSIRCCPCFVTVLMFEGSLVTGTKHSKFEHLTAWIVKIILICGTSCSVSRSSSLKKKKQSRYSELMPMTCFGERDPDWQVTER